MTIYFRLKQLFPYIASVLFIGFIFLRVLIIASNGTDLAGIEQNVIYSIQTLLNNGKLYSSPALPPFSITQYTPLYYYLCGFTAKLLGYANNGDAQLLYTIGRSWDLVFNLVTASMVFNIATRVLGISKSKAYFLFLLSFTLAFSQNFAVRPDSLCDMLGIASIYCFLMYQDKAKNTLAANLLLLFIVFLTAVAVFSKQSGIQLIIIILGFCLLIKDFGTFFKAILFSAFIYGGFLVLFKSTYPSFFDNVIGGIANGINIDNFLTYVIGKRLFILAVWPLIVAALYSLIKNNAVFKGELKHRLLAVAVLGSLTFATITALKMGSTVQYYVLFVNLVLLLIMKDIETRGLAESLLHKSNFVYKKMAFFSYLVLVMIVFGIYNYFGILQYNNVDLRNERMAAGNVARFIVNDRPANDTKYVFANLTTDTFLPARQGINNILFKSCLVPQLDILEYSTGPSKVLGYGNLENLIKSGAVEYIIESRPEQKFKLLNNLDAIRDAKFRLIKNIAGYQIYKLD